MLMGGLSLLGLWEELFFLLTDTSSVSHCRSTSSPILIGRVDSENLPHTTSQPLLGTFLATIRSVSDFVGHIAPWLAFLEFT